MRRAVSSLSSNAMVESAVSISSMPHGGLVDVVDTETSMIWCASHERIPAVRPSSKMLPRLPWFR
jgi:hypothetical protein